MIFIIQMRVLWQVKPIYYQTTHNLAPTDPNCLINKELKQAGAELCQSQVKLEAIVKVLVKLRR